MEHTREIRNAYKSVFGKPEGNTVPGAVKRAILKRVLRKQPEGVAAIYLAQVQAGGGPW